MNANVTETQQNKTIIDLKRIDLSFDRTSLKLHTCSLFDDGKGDESKLLWNNQRLVLDKSIRCTRYFSRP